jgi:hypothetical protein
MSAKRQESSALRSLWKIKDEAFREVSSARTISKMVAARMSICRKRSAALRKQMTSAVH